MHLQKKETMKEGKKKKPRNNLSKFLIRITDIPS